LALVGDGLLGLLGGIGFFLCYGFFGG